MNSREIQINFLSRDERDFTLWYKDLYDNDILDCKDYWEQQLAVSKCHHYKILCLKNNEYYHISFTIESIILAHIPNIKKTREIVIYKGYVWKNCLKEWEKHLCLRK